jgi:hypothetical protein
LNEIEVDAILVHNKFQEQDLNLGFEEELEMVKLNVDLDDPIASEVEALLQDYKELIRISPHITQHQFELDTTIP